MRLWSIHPKYLDAKGLVALWRESLLAQKVLKGKTKGYKKHPQLERFKIQKKPIESLANYLEHVANEAKKRKYKFNKTKIHKTKSEKEIYITLGQLKHEFKHLKKKLKKRAPEKYLEIYKVKKIEAHPSFKIKQGEKEIWEK